MGSDPMDKLTAAFLPRTGLIVKANNALTIIPPTTPYKPKSVFTNAAAHRLTTSPPANSILGTSRLIPKTSRSDSKTRRSISETSRSINKTSRLIWHPSPSLSKILL